VIRPEKQDIGRIVVYPDENGALKSGMLLAASSDGALCVVQSADSPTPFPIKAAVLMWDRRAPRSGVAARIWSLFGRRKTDSPPP
jgi:hypothetical protein